MAQFDPAIEIVLQQEGGYTNDPTDAGGETNFGIASASHPNVDVKNLTRDGAKAIYEAQYWDPNNYDQINDQAIANKAFSMCVNMGARSANKALQLVVGAKADGVLGPRSIAAINRCDPVELLEKYKDALWSHYEAILAAHPKYVKYRKGWYNRCYS